MRDSYPGQDEKTGIHRDLVEIGETLLFGPSQIAIPHPDVAGSRAEAYTRNRPVVSKRDIVEMLADGLAITKVVIPVDKALVESFQGSAPHHEDGQRQKLIEGNVARGIIDLDPVRPCLAPLKPRGYPLLWRKGNMAFPMELQQETPADHVPGGSIGLRPVPETAEFLR